MKGCSKGTTHRNGGACKKWGPAIPARSKVWGDSILADFPVPTRRRNQREMLVREQAVGTGLKGLYSQGGTYLVECIWGESLGAEKGSDAIRALGKSGRDTSYRKRRWAKSQVPTASDELSYII